MLRETNFHFLYIQIRLHKIYTTLAQDLDLFPNTFWKKILRHSTTDIITLLAYITYYPRKVKQCSLFLRRNGDSQPAVNLTWHSCSRKSLMQVK